MPYKRPISLSTHSFFQVTYKKYAPARKTLFSLSFLRLCRQDTHYCATAPRRRHIKIRRHKPHLIFFGGGVPRKSISTNSFPNVISTEARLKAREAEKSPASERAQALLKTPSDRHINFAFHRQPTHFSGHAHESHQTVIQRRKQ